MEKQNMESPPESPGSSHPKSTFLEGFPSPFQVNKGSFKSSKVPKIRNFVPATIINCPIAEFKSLVQQLTGVSSGCNISSDLAAKPTTVEMTSSVKNGSKIVLQWLGDPTISIIGIYGIRGVGKTALIRDIENQLRNHRRYSVSWVTLSQNFTIHRMQDDIARKIDLDLWEEDDDEKRIEKISMVLKEKNDIVLILDDLLQYIPLEKVGIPESTSGCKLIFTTQSFQVCRLMNCQKVIRIYPLSDKEGWELFIEKLVGPGMILHHSIKQIAKEIVKECSGFPLAIVSMAASMRGVNDIGEWRSALDMIKENKIVTQDKGVNTDEEVYGVLKYCYDKLKDPNVQQCLFYCAFYPEEFKIDREMLIENFIDAELIESNGHAVLDKLENAFFLEGGTCKYGKRYVKMNKSVREFLLSLSSITSPSKFSNRVPEDNNQFNEMSESAGQVGTAAEMNPDELSELAPDVQLP